jgi:hypothetical protein
MKIFLNFFFFSIVQSAFAMGDPRFFPGIPLSSKEVQHINDIEETTSGINQFAPDRGHEDQQLMEEKEMNKNSKKEKSKNNKVKKENTVPIQRPKIN